MSRADMESASPRRHTLQAAGKLPEELSAWCGVGGTRLAMMVDHLVASGESILALAWCAFSAGLSVRHRKALAVFFPVQLSCFIKRLVITQRRIADARQLVGQRAGGLVVVASPLHIQRPAAHALYLLARPLRHLGRSQHTACTVREQHAQVAVSLLGNAPQVAAAARAVLAGRQAKPAGEVACVRKVRHTQAPLAAAHSARLILALHNEPNRYTY